MYPSIPQPINTPHQQIGETPGIFKDGRPSSQVIGLIYSDTSFVVLHINKYLQCIVTNMEILIRVGTFWEKPQIKYEWDMTSGTKIQKICKKALKQLLQLAFTQHTSLCTLHINEFMLHGLAYLHDTKDQIFPLSRVQLTPSGACRDWFLTTVFWNVE